MIQVIENCLQLRGRLVSHYALLEEESITLIDGGFLTNTPNHTGELLQQAGRSLSEVKRIILTHGHIDHTLNVAELQQRTGATVFAPELDRPHIEGRFSYRGASRICGALEAVARSFFHYTPPRIDKWLTPGDVIPAWGGLEVIALHGHTPGHIGLYSGKHELLLAADLFSNYHYFPKPPPRIFNVKGSQIRESILRADKLSLRGGVLLNHCHRGTPEDHRRDLHRIALRFRASPS